MAEERTVTLTHHISGEKKEFILRHFLYSDVDAVIQCVKEEYGDTYYRREYYDSDLLMKMVREGELLLYLACCGEELCGIQSIISHGPGETRLEAASQIFRKKYRGYGLPYELVKFTYELSSALSPSCIYASSVVFHNITQSMCEDAGMVPVAFNLGSHITSKMHNSYLLGNSEKYAQAILILPVAKKDTGTVYIHPDILSTAERIYSDLKVRFNIVSEASEEEKKPEGEASGLSIKVNEREQSVSIRAEHIGGDFLPEILRIKEKYSGKYWTLQLILPVDRPQALPAYEELVKEGFFFAGLRPLCSEREEIFMQYTGDVVFYFDEYRLTERFRTLLNDIRRYRGEII